MSADSDVVLMIRSVVFAGHDIAFNGTKDVRHKFGVRLLRVLCTGMSLSDACGQHAMLLWTLCMSKTTRNCGMDVCVACLIISVKMHELNACLGLSKFATACRRLFESRESTARALEWTLQENTGMLDSKVHDLTCILKLFENVGLTQEVADVSAFLLKHAEIYLLFDSFSGQWFRYLIQLYEYLFEKTHHMPSGARMDIVLRVCGVENT